MKMEPLRTTNGKNKGSIYYRKLCDDCLKEHRIKKANDLHINEMYDSWRKYFSKECEQCGKEFNVKGNPNARKIKYCSHECRVKHDKPFRSSKEFLNKGLHSELSKVKAIETKFEIPQTKPLTKMGESHHASVTATLISPIEEKFEVHNITNFVREHEELFDPSDVNWIAAKKHSKVKAKGYRPSTAKGCKKCRASTGLLQISSGYKTNWKGWKLIRK